MKHRLIVLLLVIAVISCCTVPAMALTEDEVQNQVDTVGRAAVTGNIFIWFLCAVAFLKISQKIDSFMSSLGINVGNTGGSMLGELMIAAKGISMMAGGGGGGSHGGGGTGGGGSGSSGGGQASFMQGGLAGVVSRGVQRGAIGNANGTKEGGIGGMAYHSSLSKGGGFANQVIGNIATGQVSSTGTISGVNASQALMSYMGYTAMGEGAQDVPSFSDVEIGGGHIFATETSAEHPEGIAMGMYHTDQYMAPEGDYTTVTAADGTSWYKQYATAAVDRTPYQAEDGSVAYQENIVQRLPKIPQRKDRI